MLAHGVLHQVRALRPVHSLYTFEVVTVLRLDAEQRHSQPLTHSTTEEFRLPDGLQVKNRHRREVIYGSH